MKSHALVLLALCTTALCTTSCVTAGRYHDLEAQDNLTKTQLAADEAQISDLNGRLGNAGVEQKKLEGSVNDMKTAMDELQKRRAETDKRLSEYRELTQKFSDLVDAGKLSVKVINGKMTVGLASDVLFPSGSSRLSAAGTLAVKEVTGLLISLQGRKYQIEGHTDNVPIKTSVFPSNWELASARATSVLDLMLENGMPAERVSAASYSDTQPIASNDTPEKRAANRRIAIVIVPDLSGLPGYDELNKMSTSPKP
jgi:chemotaxis protein MotB